MRLFPIQYRELVRGALVEDLGRAGDLTSQAVVKAGRRARGRIVVRQDGVIAGVDVARLAFAELDPRASFSECAHDGAQLVAGDVVAELSMDAQALLAAERVALNFLGHLSGIASQTRRAVSLLRQSKSTSDVVCTRKTTPMLRLLEKYAVVQGGGKNHRFGLDDGILIKDNHLLLSSDIASAVSAVRASVGHMVKVEVEVDRLDQLDEVLACEVDAVLLDNMAVSELEQAMTMVAGRVVTEASGGVNEQTLVQIGSTGVDLISMGSLTHSASALDLSLELDSA